MPASNIETIYQFESALESCIETILQTDASLTCYKQKDTDIKASPWAEVQCTGISANGKQYKTGSNGFNWPIDFTSTVQVTVTTNREQNTSSHATYLGKVRRCLYDLSTYTTQRLSYLAVSLVSESGSSAVFVDDERFDQTVLQFRVNFTIRHDAWPQEAWTPADIAGLQIWLDASQIVGLNDGDAVATWTDASGNGYNATQGTASKRPIYRPTGINGAAAVQFDGVDDVLNFSTITFTGTSTVLLVTHGTSGVFNNPFGGTKAAGWYPAFTVIAYNRYYLPAGIGSINYKAITTVRDNAPAAAFRINAVDKALGSSFAYGADQADGIGANAFGQFQGYIAAVLVYSAAVSDAQIQQLETYYNALYAIY